jgi:hypothetical protein
MEQPFASGRLQHTVNLIDTSINIRISVLFEVLDHIKGNDEIMRTIHQPMGRAKQICLTRIVDAQGPSCIDLAGRSIHARQICITFLPRGVQQRTRARNQDQASGCTILGETPRYQLPQARHPRCQLCHARWRARPPSAPT